MEDEGQDEVVKGWEGKYVFTFGSLEFLCACIPDEQQ